MERRPDKKLEEILFRSETDDRDRRNPSGTEKTHRIAIISGGLKLLADRVKDLYGLDYSYGNELLVRDGKVAGIAQAVDFNGKGKILSEIAKRGSKPERMRSRRRLHKRHTHVQRSRLFNSVQPKR